MASEFAGGFYTSRAWIRTRASYIAKRRAIDGGMCEICHEQPGYIVHHKVHLTAENITDPDVSLGHGNLQFVCHACHDNIHIKDTRYRPHRVEGMERIAFTADGQPVPIS